MNIKLKGTRNGFLLTTDNKNATFDDEFKDEIDTVFKKMEKLITGATIFVHPECLPDETCFNNLSGHLTDTFKIDKTERYKEIIESEKTIPEPVQVIDDSNKTHVYSGRVRSGQKIVSNNHVVIIGDVNPGAVIVAGGDIIVLGSLLGNAIAGQTGNSDSIVIAHDFRPVQIQISNVIAAGISSSKSSNCEYACVENGAIVVLDYKKENPFSKSQMLVER